MSDRYQSRGICESRRVQRESTNSEEFGMMQVTLIRNDVPLLRSCAAKSEVKLRGGKLFDNPPLIRYIEH